MSADPDQAAEAMFSVFLVPQSMIPAKFRHPMIQLYALTALPPAPDPSSHEGGADSGA
jgi:hypothetical protein